MMKLLKISSFILIFFVINSSKVFAVSDVIVNCDNTNCEMFNSPLFNEQNLLPGDTVNKILEVNNNREEVCYLNMEISDWSESSLDFSKKFQVDINSSKSGTIFVDSLFNLFDNHTIDFETLNTSESIIYNFDVVFDANSGNEFQNKNVNFDFDVNFSCGEETDQILSLQKLNNTNGISVPPDSEVLYTLIVKTFDKPINDVIVIDLPPSGFLYKLGSWTGTVSEPTYHSPGKWQIGNMSANQTITLTYVVKIANETKNGFYPDLAWAQGEYEEDQIFANEDDGIFVGSEVIVDKNVNLSAIAVSQSSSVLGASDEKILPATGSNLLWLKLSAVLMFLGFSLIIYEKN